MFSLSSVNLLLTWFTRGFDSINGFSAVGGQTNSAYIKGGLKDGEATMGHTVTIGLDMMKTYAYHFRTHWARPQGPQWVSLQGTVP